MDYVTVAKFPDKVLVKTFDLIQLSEGDNEKKKQCRTKKPQSAGPPTPNSENPTNETDTGNEEIHRCNGNCFVRDFKEKHL